MWTSAVWLCLLFPLVAGIRWESSLPDPTTIAACQGSDVYFPMEFIQEQGDSIFNLQWLFVDGPNQTLMAFDSHGSFIALDGYQGRLEHGASGGLTLRHVTQSDKGSYSLEIFGNDASGQSFREFRTANLSVTGLLLTTAKPLTLGVQTVRDDTTGLWSVQLQCGQFQTDRPPSFSVQFFSPTGQELSGSSSYDSDSGHFTLSLPATQVESGQYTCIIPDSFAGQDCLPANLIHLGRATLSLDPMDVRLRILEAQSATLQTENSDLKTENQNLLHRLTALENQASLSNASTQAQTHAVIANLTDALDAGSKAVDNLSQVVASQAEDLKNLTGSVTSLRQDVDRNSVGVGLLEHGLESVNASEQQSHRQLAGLTQELHLLEGMHMKDKTDLTRDIADLRQAITAGAVGVAPAAKSEMSDWVSFHAQLDQNTAYHNGQSLVLTNVFTNDGHAYDDNSGIFTAPSDGTYFFIATIGSHNSTEDAYVTLVVDGHQVGLAFAHGNSHAAEMATCHAVTTLTTGQRVWLRVMLDSYFNYADTFFSGFKI